MEELKREGDVAIFSLSNKTHLLGYEVIIIRSRKESLLFGNVLPEAEYGPSNEEFGRFGWYFVELKFAEKKYLELIELENKKTGTNEGKKENEIVFWARPTE